MVCEIPGTRLFNPFCHIVFAVGDPETPPIIGGLPPLTPEELERKRPSGNPGAVQDPQRPSIPWSKSPQNPNYQPPLPPEPTPSLTSAFRLFGPFELVFSTSLPASDNLPAGTQTPSSPPVPNTDTAPSNNTTRPPPQSVFNEEGWWDVVKDHAFTDRVAITVRQAVPVILGIAILAAMVVAPIPTGAALFLGLFNHSSENHSSDLEA